MGKVRTITGDVNANELGLVYSHEHLLIAGGLGVMKNGELNLNSVDKACQEVEDVMAYGVRTFIDYMPIDCGRSPAGLVEIAKRTGANIVAVTGFHKPMYYDDLHWIYHYSIDQITELLVDEILVGMDKYSYNGPIVERMEAKAGVIKGASDYNHIKPVSAKLLEAAAQAFHLTGAPVATHTEHGTCGLEQIRLLTDQGVPPDSMIICHTDRNPDIGYHLEMLQSGVYLEYDNASRIKYWPDSTVIDLIGKVVEAGFEDRILLGTDFALRSYWKNYGGGPGMAHLVRSFIPRLKQWGIDEGVIRKFMSLNPATAYSMKEIGHAGRH